MTGSTDLKASVSRILTLASRFKDRQAADSSRRDALNRSFGYFTSHPVAPLNRRRMALILEAVEAESRKKDRALRVLDLACGGGILTSLIAMQGHRTLGIELDSDEVGLAKAFNQEAGLDGMFWKTDLIGDAFWERTAEQALGGKPDVVLLAYALHHLPQVEYFVDRLGRWLEPGSSLVINEENPESPLFRLKHRVRTWIQRDTEQEWHRTLGAWVRMLENHGFRAGQVRGADLMPGLRPENRWSLVFTATRG